MAKRVSREAHPIPMAQAAWIAGMVDGEGSIGTRLGARNYYSLYLCVTNTHKGALDLMQSLAGVGTVVTTKGWNKPIHRWVVSNGEAIGVLRQILPYMVIKREHAEVALGWALSAYGKHLTSEGRENRADIREKLFVLNGTTGGTDGHS